MPEARGCIRKVLKLTTEHTEITEKTRSKIKMDLCAVSVVSVCSVVKNNQFHAVESHHEPFDVGAVLAINLLGELA